MAKPDEVDDARDPAMEIEPAAAMDPAAEAVLRRQIDQTLRFMTVSMVIGLVVIAVIAVAVSSIRGVMILVFFVYLVTSLVARWYLRRNFMARLKGPGPGAG